MICEHCGSLKKRKACYWPYASREWTNGMGADRMCPCDDDFYDERVGPIKFGRIKRLLFNPIAFLITLVLISAFMALSGCTAIEITRCAIVQNNPNLKCN